MWIILVLLIGTVATINAWVDPQYKWHGTSYLDLKDNWKSDEMFVVPVAGYQERKFLASRLKVSDPFDILVLGSSRVFQADSSMFAPRNIFNAAASTAVIQDYISSWQLVKNERRVPKYAMIAVDPWIFNSNNRMKDWETNKLYYDQFFDSTLTDRLSPIGQSRDYATLLSLKDFAESLRYLTGRNIRVGKNKIGNVPVGFHGIRSDGSQIYFTPFMNLLPIDVVNQKALEFVSDCKRLLLCDWQFDENLYHQLVKLLQDLRSNHVKTLLIFAPYQKISYDVLTHNEPYRSIIKNFKSTIQKRLFYEKGLQFQICDAMDPLVSACVETDFIDGIHPRRSCVEKFIHYCKTQTGFFS